MESAIITEKGFGIPVIWGKWMLALSAITCVAFSSVAFITGDYDKASVIAVIVAIIPIFFSLHNAPAIATAASVAIGVVGGAFIPYDPYVLTKVLIASFLFSATLILVKDEVENWSEIALFLAITPLVIVVFMMAAYAIMSV